MGNGVKPRYCVWVNGSTNRDNGRNEHPTACKEIRCLGAFKGKLPLHHGYVMGCFLDRETGERGDALAREEGCEEFLTTAQKLREEHSKGTLRPEASTWVEVETDRGNLLVDVSKLKEGKNET